MKKKYTTESEIIAQIKRSLDGYEEAYVEGSWGTFLQKKRSRQRKLFLRIASGIAACLLVGLIGVNYLHFEKSDSSKLTAEKSVEIVREQPVAEKNSIPETPAAVVASHKAIQPMKEAGTKSVTAARLQQNDLISTKPEKTETPPVALAMVADTVSNSTTLSPGMEQLTAENKADSVKGSRDTISVKRENNRLLAIQSLEENPKDAAITKRKIRFGVNFSPGFNTTQSASSANYTGGVSADIPLSSNFQLSTGLQVENQSLVKEFPSIVASSTAPQNELKRELINLDLPLNLTWKFVTEKSHAYYVSAGVSSLVHLKQEDRNTTYSQDLIPITSLVNGEAVKSYSVLDMVSVTQNNVTPTQTFDFAGRLNLMVGFEKKLTNRFFIHIEPYTKIPTSGQSAGSFNYTTSGINFKVSF